MSARRGCALSRGCSPVLRPVPPRPICTFSPGASCCQPGADSWLEAWQSDRNFNYSTVLYSTVQSTLVSQIKWFCEELDLLLMTLTTIWKSMKCLTSIDCRPQIVVKFLTALMDCRSAYISLSIHTKSLRYLHCTTCLPILGFRNAALFVGNPAIASLIWNVLYRFFFKTKVDVSVEWTQKRIQCYPERNIKLFLVTILSQFHKLKNWRVRCLRKVFVSKVKCTNADADTHMPMLTAMHRCWETHAESFITHLNSAISNCNWFHVTSTETWENMMLHLNDAKKYCKCQVEWDNQMLKGLNLKAQQ